MATIEERMEELAKSNWRSTRGDAAAFHHHEDLERAIIADWNAAVEAMKDATLTCPYCSGDIGGWQPRQMPHGGCSHCAPLYAALAKMEGEE